VNKGATPDRDLPYRKTAVARATLKQPLYGCGVKELTEPLFIALTLVGVLILAGCTGEYLNNGGPFFP
jgi:hypothetical protein